MILTSEMLEQAIGKFAYNGDSVADQVKSALINTVSTAGEDSLCAKVAREIFKQNKDKKCTLEQTITQALSVGITIGMHVQGYEIVDGSFRRIK